MDRYRVQIRGMPVVPWTGINVVTPARSHPLTLIMTTGGIAPQTGRGPSTK